jgi:hypothetical protein
MQCFLLKDALFPMTMGLDAYGADAKLIRSQSNFRIHL